MLQIFTLRGKTSIILHYFARKDKYHITSRSSKLSWERYSCGLCYSDRRIILSCCEKRKVNYVCKKNYIPFNEQQKCHVTNIYTVDEKQKYYITFFCEKNESIILHHVLPNSPENVTHAALSCWNCNSNVETVKLNTEQFSKWRRRTDVSYGFQRNASLQNVSKW